MTEELIFAEANLGEDDNVVALCTNEECRKIIFVGNTKNPIHLRVLISRIKDHREFYIDEDGFESHEIALFYPREGPEGRMADSHDLDPQIHAYELRFFNKQKRRPEDNCGSSNDSPNT